MHSHTHPSPGVGVAEFGMRLDVSLGRRSENEEMIIEIEKILKEKYAIDSADVRWEPDPPDFGWQEELDQEELDYLQYELCAFESMDISACRAVPKIFWNEPVYPRPCCLRRLLPSPFASTCRVMNPTIVQLRLGVCFLSVWTRLSTNE